MFGVIRDGSPAATQYKRLTDSLQIMWRCGGGSGTLPCCSGARLRAGSLSHTRSGWEVVSWYQCDGPQPCSHVFLTKLNQTNGFRGGAWNFIHLWVAEYRLHVMLPVWLKLVSQPSVMLVSILTNVFEVISIVLKPVWHWLTDAWLLCEKWLSCCQ